MPSALLRCASGWPSAGGACPPPQSCGQRSPRCHPVPRCLQGLSPCLLPVSDPSGSDAPCLPPCPPCPLVLYVSLQCLLPLAHCSSHILVRCSPLSTGMQTPRGQEFICFGHHWLLRAWHRSALTWSALNRCLLDKCMCCYSQCKRLKKILRELFKYYNLSAIFLNRKVLKFLYSRDFLSKALFFVMLLVWVYIRFLPN